MARHSPERVAAVVADIPALGVSAAAEKHGVSKASASRWARAAGVETVSPERTAKAVAAVEARAAERRATVTERLWEIADEATRRELDLIRTGKLRDVVGARTRAIHDAELLAGRATSRAGHEETVDAEIAKLVEELKARA